GQRARRRRVMVEAQTAHPPGPGLSEVDAHRRGALPVRRRRGHAPRRRALRDPPHPRCLRRDRDGLRRAAWAFGYHHPPGKILRDAYRSALGSIAQAVGRTPLVTLNRVTARVTPPIHLKLEWYGATGSLKDRIYLHMFDRAEARGDLRP